MMRAFCCGAAPAPLALRSVAQAARAHAARCTRRDPPSRGSPRCRAAGARGNFNPNDPATWGSQSEGDGAVVEAFQVDNLQQLSDVQLAALLSQGAGAQAVPPQPARALPATPRAPEDAASAIAQGLQAFKAGDAAAALSLFNASMELPGSGVRRTKGGPRELSQGERQAALYNAACCHALGGDTAAGLAALRACVAAGFDDWSALRRDADLAPLRSSPEWARFAAGFEAQAARSTGILGGFFGGR
jgi:hypothetical protein